MSIQNSEPEQASRRLRPWHQRYPERWNREREELQEAGWSVEVSETAMGPVLELEHSRPVMSWRDEEPPTFTDGTEPRDNEASVPRVRLSVRFPVEYPFFPPLVSDVHNTLGLGRHRNASGALCLVEDEDWHVDLTLAELLARQVPNLLAARDARPPAPGVEARLPEPVTALVRRVGAPAVVMPGLDLPPGTDQGALMLAYGPTHSSTNGLLVTRVLGQGIDVPGPANKVAATYDLNCFGRWIRDPYFDPHDSAERTYQRLLPRLKPLTVDPHPTRVAPGDTRTSTTLEVGLEALEVLLLAVPGEVDYRTHDTLWIAVLRHRLQDPPACEYLPVQILTRDTLTARTHSTRGLSNRHVVLVGLGAAGGHIATDLTRTGVSFLDLVDGDTVDVTTATRQHAPLHAAGHSKAQALVEHLAHVNPFVDVVGYVLRLGVPMGDNFVPERARFDAAIENADLVIDATASPAATRYLAAVRHVLGRGFLHVSSTAGAWGGCVFLATNQSGCWECLHHHRLDGAVPVPPADPAGQVHTPGCSNPTFTGTNPDLATIAHHASRVAIDHLTHGSGLGGDLYVAHLRDRHGPIPVSWETARVPVHPACPLHDRAAVTGRAAS